MSDALGKLFEENNAAILARKQAAALEEEQRKAAKDAAEIEAFDKAVTSALGPEILAVLSRPFAYKTTEGKITFNFTVRNRRFDLVKRDETSVELELPSYVDAMMTPPRFEINSLTARQQFLSGLESIFRFL